MRAAVLGSPIAHSLSPRLHHAAYDALGLTDWTYDAVEMTSDGLPSFLEGLGPEWAGLSLTMPLKRTVVPLVLTWTREAQRTRVVNTVTFAPPGIPIGHNTDVHGIVAALQEAGVASARRVVILGGGATARSAMLAVSRIGCRRPHLVVRRDGQELVELGHTEGFRQKPTWSTWTPDVLDGCDLLISTLPAGAADDLAAHVAAVPALLDVVYDPWPTALAAACRGVVVSGMAMLLHQAAAQVELMTGQSAPLEAMRAVLP